MMTAVKQGPPKPRCTLEVAPAIPETAALSMEMGKTEAPDTSVPSTFESDKSHAVQKLAPSAVPKSLGHALPTVPAPLLAAGTAHDSRAPPADGTAPEGQTKPTQIPMDVLAKLKELEELKAKYAGLLNQTSSSAPVAAMAPLPPPVLPEGSCVSPPEQKQVFTPENSQGHAESIAPGSSGKDSVATMELEGQNETHPAADALSADEDDQLHEAYNLEHKDIHLSGIFLYVDGKSWPCHRVVARFHGTRWTNSVCVVCLSCETNLARSFGQELTPHALYMRLKRLCTPTPKGRLQVSKEVADQWQEGNRDELQLALVKAIKQFGFDNKHSTLVAVRAGLFESCCFNGLTSMGHAPPLAGTSLTGRIRKADAQAQRNEDPT